MTGATEFATTEPLATRTTTTTTTSLYHHLHVDDEVSYFDYDFEFPLLSKDHHRQQQQQQQQRRHENMYGIKTDGGDGDVVDDDDKDYDDDDDEDEDDSENISAEFSGKDSGGGVGERRDIFDKYDENFYSTQRQSSSSSSSYPRTKISKSGPRINEDAFLRVTARSLSSTAFRVSAIFSFENQNANRKGNDWRDRKRLLESNSDFSKDLPNRSSSSSAASIGPGGRRTVPLFVLCWVRGALFGAVLAAAAAH